MKTIRYYTDTNKYMGCQALEYTKHYLEWTSWLNSGNKLKIEDNLIKNIKELNSYRATLRLGSNYKG
jgi:hypothetical protein